MPALFSCAYAGSVAYYAALLRCDQAVIAADEPVVPHSSWIHSHCRILGPGGVQTLAIPIVNSHPATVGQMQMATLPRWRRIHWGALYSAYGRSPFFDYFAPELEKLYTPGGPDSLYHFNTLMHSLIVDFLDLPITTLTSPPSPHTPDDRRHAVGEGKPACAETQACLAAPYYQVWAGRNGFTPCLSILDLLFNTGREAIFTLQAVAETLGL